MRKAIFATFAIVSLLVSSCVVTTTPQVVYNPYYNFITEDIIKKGERLKDEYPDESFLLNRVSLTYSFEVDETVLKKPDSDKDSKPSKKKKKKKTKTINISEDDDMDDLTNKLKDALDDAEWPESGLKVYEKNEYDVVALNDKLSYQNAIFYNGSESISKVTATYANTSSSEFTVSTYKKNYDDQGTFHSDVKMAIMSVPMYVIGNSLQYNYTRTYHDYRYLTTIYLPEGEPCKEKVVSFEIPTGLDVEILEYNFAGYNITRTEGEAPKAVESEDGDEDDDDDDNNKKKKKRKTKKKKDKKKSKSQSANTKTINYVIKDAPAMGGESYNYGPTHSVPHLLVMCKSYTNGTDTIPLMKTTDDLYNWYSTLAGNMDNDNSDVKKVAEKLVVGKTTDEEKISAIFYWVQDNIRYLAFEDGLAAFKPDECQNVYEKRYGDCKGMANLTKEMLKSVGYDARLTWIGTSRIAYDGTMPTLSSANHMICVVYPDSNNRAKRYFLDGTEKYVSFGDYADRIQGRKVVIEDGKNYFVDSIPVFEHPHNKVEKTETYSVSNNLLTGTVKRTYHGESKTNIIRSYNNVKLDARERALRSFLNNNDFNLAVSDVTHTDFDERNKPFEINYKLDVKNRILTDGNQLFINPEWDREWANFQLDTARLTHYSFLFKKNLSKTTNINIPAGYKVATLPPAVSIKNEFFQFSLSYKQQGNTIVYTKEIILPKGYMHRNHIKEWNAAIEQVTAFYDNYIVLKK